VSEPKVFILFIVQLTIYTFEPVFLGLGLAPVGCVSASNDSNFTTLNFFVHFSKKYNSLTMPEGLDEHSFFTPPN